MTVTEVDAIIKFSFSHLKVIKKGLLSCMKEARLSHFNLSSIKTDSVPAQNRDSKICENKAEEEGAIRCHNAANSSGTCLSLSCSNMLELLFNVDTRHYNGFYLFLFAILDSNLLVSHIILFTLNNVINILNLSEKALIIVACVVDCRLCLVNVVTIQYSHLKQSV